MNHYSQHEEDEIIHGFFGDRVASFLDIGAWDGVELSNTRALADRGWRGILVEPCPSAFVKLIANTRSNPKLVCVNSAVGVLKYQKFYLQNEWGGTLSYTMASSGVRQTDGEFYLNPMIGEDLSIIAFKEKVDCEFISIDTEGTNEEVLLLVLPVFAKAELVCVEVDNHQHAMTDPIPAACARLGFNKFVGKTSSNILMART